MATDNKRHIDLGENGLPGQWMDLVDLGTFSQADFEEITAKDDPDAATIARDFIAAVVTAWHLKTRSGRDLPAPDSPDLDPKQIPVVAQSRFKAEIEIQLEDVRNPKTSRSA